MEFNVGPNTHVLLGPRQHFLIEEAERITLEAKRIIRPIIIFIRNSSHPDLLALSRRVGSLLDDTLASGISITDEISEFCRKLQLVKRQLEAGKPPLAKNAIITFLYKHINLYLTDPNYKNFIDILNRYIPKEYNKTSNLERSPSRMTGGTRKATAVKIRSGDTFHVEHPKKRWTRSKKYKKWLGKLTRKQSKNTQAEDLCIGKKSICKGDLGIPRKYMPQFENMSEIRSFRTFVKKVYKIKSCKARRTARQLRPSQGEISKPRVNAMLKKGVIGNIYFPLVISGDNFVVDGHHRWAAYRLKKPDVKLPVVMIDAPIKDILGLAVAWGAKHHEF